MVSFSLFKNTIIFSFILMAACGNSIGSQKTQTNSHKPEKIITEEKSEPIKTGADNFNKYMPLLRNKKVGIVTNQTGIIILTTKYNASQNSNSCDVAIKKDTLSIVDFLINRKIDVTKIYAPEHGFRGTADAGELIKDGKDTKTGLPIISLYGSNKKPKPEQLQGIDILVFDLQDVGARFYTYISSLHYIMEACAENNIPLIVLDRPNPNGGIVDGPILETENQSFIGMHPIPVLHGMTIGEYAQMINGEKWLKDGVDCKLTVIPCENYSRDMIYGLPVKPSPNLPNDQAINLYASLCFFEGTNVSSGRGTDKQFQIYGSPFLPKSGYRFTPSPNEGAKDPMHNGKVCYGENLSKTERVKRLELKWLINAYHSTEDKSKFFIPFFTKLAGTKTLQQQIEKGLSEDEIRQSWQPGLKEFRLKRERYLIYKP